MKILLSNFHPSDSITILLPILILLSTQHATRIKVYLLFLSNNNTKPLIRHVA